MIWIFAVALLALLVWLILPGKTPDGGFAAFNGRYIAHRGLHNTERDGSLVPLPDAVQLDALIPENTMAAFLAAKEAGYGIELDIQLSADGQVVVFHDDNLLRACGEDGMVANHTYEQLQQFGIMGTTEGIPLLTDVLRLVDGSVPLIVELKRGWRNRQLCQAAWSILREYDGPFCIESFDPTIVRWFRGNAPAVLRGQLAAPGAELDSGIAGYLHSWGLSAFLGRPHFTAYKTGNIPMPVRLCQRLSHSVAWTVRPDEDMAELERNNDAIIFEYFMPQPSYRE